jgi:NAD(P)-dependent dehydrogenase (short-subunit alcohol dehydrogenase family)
MLAHDAKRTVLIGGIGGGIGSALARRLLREGWAVAGYGRPGASLEAFRERHPTLPVFSAEATASAEVEEVFLRGEEALGHLDAYVHAIGSVFLKPAHLTSDAEWHEVLAVNLHSAFYAARAALKGMRRRKAGRLVFCGSVAARLGLANHEAIAGAKGGIEGLVKALAASYQSLGIRVNGVALGLVETPATAGITGVPTARQVSERMHPVGRLGTAEEAAGVLAWLLSPEADWVTGQVWGFDGGMGVVLPRPRA